MNSAFKPIVATFEGLPALQLHSYSVELYNFASASSVEIYRGWCFADGYRKASIRIDGVCRDYIHRHLRKWAQDRQNYIPSALSTLGTPRTPDDYIFTAATVKVYYQGNVEETTVPLWGGWLPEWQKGELTYWPGVVANLAMLGNDIVPHIPPVDSVNMWLGMVLVWLDENNVQPSFGTTLSRVDLPTTGAGCYDLAYTLHDIYTAFGSEVDGGASDTTPSGEVDGGNSENGNLPVLDGGDSETHPLTVTGGGDFSIKYGDTILPVAHVDECASPYYVAWMLPSGGWFCWGFDGNASVSATMQAETIRDVMDTERVVGVDMQAFFDLYTGFLSRDQYNILSTVAYAREVYLYDAVRDHGTWCTVESKSIPTAGNVRWRNEPLHLTLKEILHTEI